MHRACSVAGTQAAPVAGILFFAFLAPYQLLATDITSTSRAVKMMCSLSFNVALTLGVDIVSLAGTVSSGEGSRWSNYHLPAFPEDKLSLKDCMAMLLVDSALHCIITWYLDHVRPGEHGIAKSPWFCFSLSYWFPYEKSSVGDLPRQGSGPNVSVFQPEPTDVEPEVQIINLQKTFGDKQVVKSTNLSMYKDEIFVLIGHNGCGKSITLGMITGFVPPSSGNVIIKGYDIRTNLEAVRKYLGVCPQFNILFQSLTVREHLSLIAQLKGLSGQELANDVHHIAREMGLKQKLDSLASRLCEGHQRQLSVAIALIGNPEVIILDEPTAGMDPAARRNTWHLLKRIRKNRTVIMTTHFMDEADLLGDRIAMMQNGEVKCCGTSAFLKDVYGLGYHLVITIGPICNISDLAEAIMNHVETAQFESVLGNTATFTLPFEETPKFPGLFLELNSKMDELNIFNFGISTPSIEEVFLEVVGQNEDVMSLAYSGSLVIPGHSCVARLSEARSIRAMTATSLHHATSDINKAKLGDPQSHELVLQDSKPSQNTLNAVVEFCKQMQGQVASESEELNIQLIAPQLTIRRCSAPAMGCGASDAGRSYWLWSIRRWRKRASERSDAAALQLWAVEHLTLEIARQLTIRRCSTRAMGCGASDAGGSAPANDPTLQRSSYGLWSI
ncbi:hypothetical protein RRG08_058397 [Elysia crispata]|uniref:ABC transporter domain-containing protein n=1 Tax=Elysia crispata TaxID=231223 RepID=A0AAE0XXD7_9GAST|nr:hypothetical protein RRG08_058397 [Elysia crispata]